MSGPLSPPEIVGVIDLQGGLAVHGVAGQRHLYRQLRCPGLEEPTARALGALYRRLGVKQLYLADLDAIAGAEPNWNAYSELLADGHALWVDAGVDSARRGAELAEFQSGGRALEGVIVGSESLLEPAALGPLTQTFGAERWIFSLDLREGVAVTRASAWSGWAPIDVAAAAIEQGLGRLIVLDVSAVGTSCGVRMAPLLETLHARYPRVELISGGGVRGMDDALEFRRAGCSAVLVATALLEGRLEVCDEQTRR